MTWTTKKEDDLTTVFAILGWLRLHLQFEGYGWHPVSAWVVLCCSNLPALCEQKKKQLVPIAIQLKQKPGSGNPIFYASGYWPRYTIRVQALRYDR